MDVHPPDLLILDWVVRDPFNFPPTPQPRRFTTPLRSVTALLFTDTVPLIRSQRDAHQMTV